MKHLLLAVCCLAPQRALSQTGDPTSTWRFEISGNNRTQDSFIENLGRRCIEDYTGNEEELPAAVAQCIKNSRLFASVEATRLEGKALAIKVDERWTLLAMPFVMANNSGRSGVGLFAAESNFLGLGKQVVLGGSYGQTGSSFMILGNDRSIGFSRWQGLVLAAKSKRFFELQPKDRLLDSFEENRTTVALGIGYNFPSKITPQIGVDFSNRTYERHKDFEQPDDLQDSRLTAQVRWSQKSYQLYFDSGFGLDASSSVQVWRNDEAKRAWLSTVGAQWGYNPIFDHAILISCRAQALLQGDKRDAPKLGGGAGLRGFVQQTLWADRIASCASDYQVPLYKASFGTWTAAPLFDGGWARLADAKSVSFAFSSTGGGVYLFLNQVTLPGMGLACYHNFYNKKEICQFTLGAGGGGGGE